LNELSLLHEPFLPSLPATNAKRLREGAKRRSNPTFVRGKGGMDCVAEPVIGRRLAPTRWLAMTEVTFAERSHHKTVRSHAGSGLLRRLRAAR
jgi:hypothetical protein